MTSSEAAARTRQWRVSKAGLIAGWTLIAVFSAVAIALLVAALLSTIHGNWSGAGIAQLAFAALALVFPVYAWFWSIKPRLYIDGSALVIVNPLSKYRVELSDIADVQSGYSGLLIRSHDGGGVIAWAVQKSNVMFWVGNRHTRSDKIAAEILAHAPNATPEGT